MLAASCHVARDACSKPPVANSKSRSTGMAAIPAGILSAIALSMERGGDHPNILARSPVAVDVLQNRAQWSASQRTEEVHSDRGFESWRCRYLTLLDAP